MLAYFAPRNRDMMLIIKLTIGIMYTTMTNGKLT